MRLGGPFFLGPAQRGVQRIEKTIWIPFAFAWLTVRS